MTDSTATTQGARDHARAMAGTVVAAMPTIPPADAVDLPEGVAPSDVLWDEVVAPGGYTSVTLPRGGHLRLVDLDGDACAGLLVHRADRTSERLNVADTVKVQWQAYLGPGSLLLSDMGRVLAALVADTSARHDALCGTSTRAGNATRYGDGGVDGPCPNGRDRFAVALAKHGLSRRDVAPNLNLFKGAPVAADGSLSFDGEPRPGAAVTLRAELPLLVTVVDVPHPLDPRPDYTVTPLRVTAWRGRPAGPDDPARRAGPEAERAYLNTELEVDR
ncbi:MAG: urea amidolyase associated protein UAAP1 [Acidimicrobiia bacterium]